MELFKKLFELKSELGKISKDSTNPFFKSKYFDINSLLEHVEPLASKHGLLILQPIREGFVVTEIINPEDGEKVTSQIKLSDYTDPQKMGSAITYFRRYTLQSLLGLQAEDDDGNRASQPTKTKVYPKLTDEGYSYLTSDKAKKEEIGIALTSRSMTIEQKEKLTKLFKSN